MELESTYATSFTNVITSGTYMFNGCTSLVGGADGKYISTTSMGSSLCKLGTGGMLTDPSNDSHTWFHGFRYSYGSVVLSVSSATDPNKTLAGSGRICANANYNGTGHLPWGTMGQNSIVSAEFAVDMAGLSALTTILADSTWALPSSGISGASCFYGCSTNLVGGNGTVWSSSNTGYQYMRIDAGGSPGYLTAA